MRRFLLPAIVLAVVIAAAALAGRANDAADPTGDSVETQGARLETPLLSVRRAPEWLRQPASDEALRRAVSAATRGLHENDAHCVSVRRDGVPIADINSDVGLIPGAVQRLVTLELFGSQSTRAFTTDIVRSSSAVITDGVLEGDVWVVGGADPVLATGAFIDRFGDDRPYTSIEELADLTVAALQADGIAAIAGGVIADPSKYGQNRVDYGPETWTDAEEATNEVGALSALIANNGFDSFAETVDPAARSRASSPPLHAVNELRAALEARGIAVGDTGVGDQPAPTDRVEVATIESPSVLDIAQRAYLDATTAEMLYLEFGERSGGGGDQGEAFFAAAESDLAPPTGGFFALDGSGLSLGNQARCDLLNDILDGGPDALAVGALPMSATSAVSACTPATLDDLQVYAAARPEVTSIVGRATTPNGDIITFSMIVNWAVDEASGDLLPRTACDGVVAALLDAIDRHPTGPNIAEFSPLDVVEPA